MKQRTISYISDELSAITRKLCDARVAKDIKELLEHRLYFINRILLLESEE